MNKQSFFTLRGLILLLATLACVTIGLGLCVAIKRSTGCSPVSICRALMTNLATTQVAPASALPPVVHPGWTSYTKADRFSDLAFDHDGNLWIASHGGVIRWNLADNTYTKYTAEHGLVGNRVMTVAAAPNGDLWFGTLSGISHFDGEAWMSYTTEDGLAGDLILSIAVASDGTPWANTDSGVCRFDGETWIDYTAGDGLADDDVEHIFAAPDDAMWFSTRRGVSRFDGETWTTYTTDDGLPDNSFWAIAVAPDGTLRFGHRDGVSSFDGKTWTTHPFESDAQVHDIAAAPDGSLLFVTSRANTKGDAARCPCTFNISRFDGETWTPYTTFDSLPICDVSAGYHLFSSIVPGPDNALWFSTKRGEVLRLDGKKWSSYAIADDGPVGASIFSIAVAPGGTLWVSTDNLSGDYGVFRFDGKTWNRYTTRDGLAREDVSSIVVAPDGTLWFGTYGGGVSRFDGETWTTYTTADGLANNRVTSIAVASDGALWFGTEHGVSRFDGETWATYTAEDGLADDHVQEVAIAPDGTPWVGTVWGIARFDGKTWTSYTNEEGLANYRVASIAVAPDGALWFDTEQGATFRFDGESFGSHPSDFAQVEPQDEDWISYTTDYGPTSNYVETTIIDPELLDDIIRRISQARNYIETITVAPDGALWVGTARGDIFRFDGETLRAEPQDEAWITYTTDESLAHDGIRSIAVAPDGALWFSHGAGVSRFDGETWTRYTTQDGLASNNVGPIAVAPDGALWFGTVGGISRYIPPD